MPPYSPLATPAVKLPDWFMNPQFQELDSAILDQRKVDAQGLVNEANQIQLEQAQRKNESQRAISEALKRYASDINTPDVQSQGQPEIIGQNADQSPIYGDTPASADTSISQGINVRKLLDVYGQAALQSGDPEATLAAIKAGRETTGDRILTPDEIALYGAQGINLPIGTTLQGARLASSIRNGTTQVGRVEDLNTRFNTKLDYTKSTNSAPGVFDNALDENGKPKVVDSAERKNLTQMQRGLDTILRNSDELATDISTNRYPIGDVMRKQEAAIANMLPALRALDNQGVRFNEFIKDIDIQQLGDDASLVHRIAGTFVGQDPVAAVTRFAEEVARQAQSTANANDARFSADKVNQFDPQTGRLYEKYGVYGRGQSSIPKAPSALTNTLPSNPDGSPLSRAEWEARRKK